MHCSNCDAANDAEARFCVNCGSELGQAAAEDAPGPKPETAPTQASQTDLFCTKCGTANESGASYCVSCGEKLEVPAVQEAPAPEPEPEQAPAPEPKPAPSAAPPPTEGPKEPRRFPVRLVLVASAAAAGIAVIVAALFLIGGADDEEGAELLNVDSRQCIDTEDRPCEMEWFLMTPEETAAGLKIAYLVKVTGEDDCEIPNSPDEELDESRLMEGRPGIFLEGSGGQYFARLSSEALGNDSDLIECGEEREGAWTFATPGGNQDVTLRHPLLNPILISLPAEGMEATAQELAADTEIAVVPVASAICQTTMQAPCSGDWELGPVGYDASGSPLIFFRVEFRGPPGCSIGWISDMEASELLVEQGRDAIQLERNDGPPLELVAAGGLGTFTGEIPCQEKRFGWWQFAEGRTQGTSVLVYPDLGTVQLQFP